MEEIPSAETERMRSEGMPKYMLSLQAKTDRIFVSVNVPNFMYYYILVATMSMIRKEKWRIHHMMD